MKILKIPIPYIIMVFVGVVCYQIYSLKNTADVVSFVTTVLGMVVSLYAYVIALKTYESIDSVSVITQMEGNVLENENYAMSMTQLLKDFNMSDSKRLGDAVFQQLENKFLKESRTAIEFANNLQYFIDIIVFVPYLFNSDENKEKMNRIISMIEKRKNDLLKISNGNLILIEETVKLINCVINYQKLVYTTDYKTALTLLEVRGTMLKNSVTQIVYYNYLGLFYNAKANNILRKRFNLEGLDFFSIDGLKTIKSKIHLLSDEENELFTIYLKEAKRAFHKALDNGKDEMMWEGFIKFNEARTSYLLQLVYPEYEGRNWKVLMDESIVARSRLNILIKDILNNTDEPTHLQEAFIFEHYLASLVRMNLLIVENMNITDMFDRVKYAYPHYEGMLCDPLLKEPYKGKFERINKYQNSLSSYLGMINEKRGA